MRVLAQPFWTPKAGHRDTEYEDACWPTRRLERRLASGGHGPARLRLAVADGATESSFSGIWARLLVRGFCAGRLDGADPLGCLTPLQRRWGKEVGARPLPWYAEEKRRSGAFATLMGLVLDDESACARAPRRWSALALGDSCMVQMRGERILTRFPLDHSSRFGSTPFLLSSNPSRNQGAQEHLQRLEGTWEPGDAWYLMTDALAAWFLRRAELGERPWTVLRALEAPGLFAAWVDEERLSGQMRNDDVTLLRLDAE